MRRLYAAPLMVLLATLWSQGIIAPPPSRPATDISFASLSNVSNSWREVPVDPGTNMVGFKSSNLVELEARVQRGGTWRPPLHLEMNPDEGPDGQATKSTAPLWLGPGVERLQVRSHDGRQSLTAILIASALDAPRPATSYATPAQPQIISRAEWGADESWKRCQPDVAADARNAFVHHTATSNGYSIEEVGAIVRGIYRYHTFGNGWCDIGYNFLIDRFGRILEGRSGGIDKAVVGAHAGGFNTSAIGVSIIGDHTSGGMSSQSSSALHSLLTWKFAHHGIDAGSTIQATSGGSTRYPAGTVATLWTISGHRDVSATACPGAIQSSLPTLRPNVQTSVMASPPYPLPGWTPRASDPALVTLDAYGGLHPAGSAAAVTHTSHWAGFPIARGGFLQSRNSGYVVDGFGGLHAFGSATPAVTPSYWNGWDIVRGATRGPALGSGYFLDGWGGLHSFGGAVRQNPTGYWPGFDIARAITTNSGGTGGYVLDGYGGLHSFGTAPPVSVTSYWGGFDIARGLALRPDGRSGYVLDGWGGVHAFGGAPRIKEGHYTPYRDIHRGIVLNSSGDGGWILDTDGRIWPFGNSHPVKHSMTWEGLGLGRSLLMVPTSGPVL